MPAMRIEGQVSGKCTFRMEEAGYVGLGTVVGEAATDGKGCDGSQNALSPSWFVDFQLWRGLWSREIRGRASGKGKGPYSNSVKAASVERQAWGHRGKF